MAREYGPEATLRDVLSESLRKKHREKHYRKFETKRALFSKRCDLVDWISGPVSNGDVDSAYKLLLGYASAPGCPTRHGDVAFQIHADEEVITRASVEHACRRSAHSHPCQRY